MPPRHNPEKNRDQGALFVEHEGAVTLSGMALDHGGVYFRPVIESERGAQPRDVTEVAPRRDATYEYRALDNLAAESRCVGLVKAKNIKVIQLTKRFGDSHPELPELYADIERSLATGVEHRLAAKLDLATSLGIPAERVTEVKTAAGGRVIIRSHQPQTMTYIKTLNPDDQHRLDSANRRFRGLYAGAQNHKTLSARRRALKPLLSVE